MKNVEKPQFEHSCPGTEEAKTAERFLIRPMQPPRSLLPDEAWPKGEGALLVLEPDADVAGVAGTGGIALGGEYLLGGWCSFRCRLAVPRRFAAREGERLAAGAPMDGILSGRLSHVLQALLAQADWRPPESASWLKMRLNRQLQAEARRELMGLGWQVTHCRLEKILITRRESA